jgi:hypothetical protein
MIFDHKETTGTHSDLIADIKTEKTSSHMGQETFLKYIYIYMGSCKNNTSAKNSIASNSLI